MRKADILAVTSEDAHGNCFGEEGKQESEDTYAETLAEWPLRLQLFSYQVSGHCGLLRLSEFAICKLLNFREHSFYQQLPPTLRQFTADYFGVIEVRWIADSAGQIVPVGRPLELVRADVLKQSQANDQDTRRSVSVSMDEETQQSEVSADSEMANSADNSLFDAGCSQVVIKRNSHSVPQALNRIDSADDLSKAKVCDLEGPQIKECRNDQTGSRTRNWTHGAVSVNELTNVEWSSSYSTWSAGMNPWAIEQHRRALSRLTGRGLQKRFSRALATAPGCGSQNGTIDDLLRFSDSASRKNLRCESKTLQGTADAICETDSGNHTMQDAELSIHELSDSSSVLTTGRQHSPRPESETSSFVSDNTMSIAQTLNNNEDLSETFLTSKRERFIVLENAAAKFRNPSIMDLKMGTRQHGDDASANKASHQQIKCQTSTSSVLGVRIGGVQIYKPLIGNYLYRDKYYGRQLNAAGFSEALRKFVDDGVNVRVDVIQKVLDQLHELRKRIEQLGTYRFYSSSLLILFDERRCCSHGTCNRDCPARRARVGFQSKASGAEVLRTGRFESHPIAETDAPMTSSCFWTSENDLHVGCVCECARVDVRMIDFAHATFRGFLHDEQVHQGADHGYLRGLNCLVDEFEKLHKSLMSSST